jgi:hypothetical protein
LRKNGQLQRDTDKIERQKTFAQIFRAVQYFGLERVLVAKVVRGGGFENPQAKNDDGSEEFNVIDISKLKAIGS